MDLFDEQILTRLSEGKPKVLATFSIFNFIFLNFLRSLTPRPQTRNVCVVHLMRTAEIELIHAAETVFTVPRK